MDLFQTSIILDKVESRKDNSLKLILGTQELSPEAKGKVMGMVNRLLWVAFCDAEIKAEDLQVPDVVLEYKGEKSPSQRMRAVLYRLWEQTGKAGDFEVYYRSTMDRIIDHYKEKLT